MSALRESYDSVLSVLSTSTDTTHEGLAFAAGTMRVKSNHYTVLYLTVLHYTILYYSILLYQILQYTIASYTTLYNTKFY